MRTISSALCALLLGAAWLAPTPGWADVPRSCVYPHYDPLACPRDTRLVLRDVLPLARLRAMDAQRSRLARAGPHQEAARSVAHPERGDEREAGPGRSPFAPRHQE